MILQYDLSHVLLSSRQWKRYPVAVEIFWALCLPFGEQSTLAATAVRVTHKNHLLRQVDFSR